MMDDSWRKAYDEENRRQQERAKSDSEALYRRLSERDEPEREERRRYGLGSGLIAGLIGWLAGRKSRE